MPDYSKGKIYKLWSPSKNLVYYGSTCETLSQRLAKHKYSHKIYIGINDKRKDYCYSYLILECEDYKIELLEDYPSNNKSQLEKKESEYIENNECVNFRIEGRKRTNKEWYNDNKEKIIEKSKEWYKNNKEQKAEYDKQYAKKNKEKIAEYQKQRRLKQKQLVIN